MSVFQAVQKGGKRAKVWRIDFKDHRGIRRRVSGFRDKKASEQLERIIEQLVNCRHNEVLPGAELARAIESMRPGVRRRLIAFGVLDERKEHAAKGIADHLGDYQAVLIAQGVSNKHSNTVYARCLAIFTAAGCHTLSDITRDRVQIAADKLRVAEGISPWTHNHRLGACKSFTKWATEAERLSRDPLQGLKGLRKHRKCPRRSLSADETRALLAAAEAGPVVWGLPSSERHMLYELALATGFRASELASLTRASLKLEGNRPAVFLDGRAAKNGEDATQRIPASLALRLRAYTATMMPGAKLFPNLNGSNHTAEMIRRDLKAAGIEYKTSVGKIDFHALRHTFITNLARAGVHPKKAQILARHSSSALTMEYYTHLDDDDMDDAVESIPDFDTPKAETA